MTAFNQTSLLLPALTFNLAASNAAIVFKCLPLASAKNSCFSSCFPYFLFSSLPFTCFTISGSLTFEAGLCQSTHHTHSATLTFAT